MIRELYLQEFGKFRDRRFQLDKTTLFVGKNEAGKTTLFDGLFQALCSPKANKAAGRRLKERYGEQRQASALFTARAEPIEEDEFLNLYAIRCGDISLDLNSSDRWMDNVKARLFTGGIDPSFLKLKFENLASTKKSLKHNRTLQELERGAQELRDELESLQKKRETILAQEPVFNRARSQAEDLRRRISREEQELAGWTEAVVVERKIARRRVWNYLLEKLEKGEQRDNKLRQLAQYSDREVQQLDRLREEQLLLRGKRDEAQNASQRAKVSCRQKRAQLKTVERDSPAQKKSADLAAVCLERINAYLSRPSKRSGWSRPLILLGLFFFLTGLGLGILLFRGQLQILSGVAGLVLGVICIVLSRGARGAQGGIHREQEFVRRLKDEWRNRSMDQPGLESETLSGCSNELRRFHTVLEHNLRDMTRLNEELLALEAELTDRQDEVVGLDRRLDLVDRQIHKWLESRAVSTRDHYIERLAERRSLAAEQLSWQDEIKRELEQYDCSSPGELKRDCLRRLSELDREAIPGRGRSQDELRRIEEDLHSVVTHLSHKCVGYLII